VSSVAGSIGPHRTDARARLLIAVLLWERRYAVVTNYILKEG